jgi:phage terminase large subunit-like protein
MPTRVLADDVDAELLGEYQRIEREYNQQAPRRFMRKWRCNRTDCDGKPHEGWSFKHARSQQVIPSSWTYTEIGSDPENPVIITTSRIAYLVGGRGSGKTWAGAHNFAQLVLETQPEPGDDHTEWAVIAPTYRSARHVCIEGPSGLIRAFGGFTRHNGLVEKWNRSDGELMLSTGAIIYIDGATDGAERIQGENLYGAWCDEIGLWKSWKRAWEESLAFAVRIGPARIICTGTPKLSSLAKYLLDDPRVWRRRLRTKDNLANLAASAIQDLMDRYAGTRLGQQELEGILVDDVEGALWRRANIDEDRVHEHVVLDGPQQGKVYWERADGTQMRPPSIWHRVIIALDPADGDEDGDEQGIAVVAQSADDNELYVLHSDGMRVSPFEFLSEAVDLALTFYPNSVEIVMEKNHGGKFLLGLMDQVLKAKEVSVPYRSVDAVEGKRTRAEDVSGLYERHKVHHVGTFADLEDQQCTWTGLGNEPSPDRMDALVWALKQFVTVNLALQAPGDVPAMVFQSADSQGFVEPKSSPESGAREMPPIHW